MTHGNCRVTIIDQDGRPAVADAKEGDLRYFPAGLPHSLQGRRPDGAKFVLGFDNGESSEFNTSLVTDWLAHTPPEALARNFGAPAEAFTNIPLQKRWIFQGKEPPPLSDVENAIAAVAGKPSFPFVFNLAGMRTNRIARAGREDGGGGAADVDDRKPPENTIVTNCAVRAI